MSPRPKVYETFSMNSAVQRQQKDVNPRSCVLHDNFRNWLASQGKRHCTIKQDCNYAKKYGRELTLYKKSRVQSVVRLTGDRFNELSNHGSIYLPENELQQDAQYWLREAYPPGKVDGIFDAIKIYYNHREVYDRQKQIQGEEQLLASILSDIERIIHRRNELDNVIESKLDTFQAILRKSPELQKQMETDKTNYPSRLVKMVKGELIRYSK